jgi:hypothetical protein
MLITRLREWLPIMNGNGKKLKNRRNQAVRHVKHLASRPHGKDADLLVAPRASDGALKEDPATESQGLDRGQHCWAREVISSCGAGEGRDTETLRSSQLRCGNCADLVHELANTMAAVLLNTQLLEWKLPPYSRLKRAVLEVERNAQRGGELLKRLRQKFGERTFGPGTMAETGYGVGKGTVVTAQEPSGAAAGMATLLPKLATASAPGFSPGRAELTLDCDPCTSSFFPKGDDGNER